MKLTRWLMLLALGSVIATACGGGAKPSATVSPPTATVAPTTVGPILVYTDETPFAERTGHIDTFVIAYDVAAGRQLRRTVVPQTFLPEFEATTGDVIYVGRFSDGSEIHAVNAITGVDRIVYRSGLPLSAIALSHDGVSLAVLESESEDQLANSLLRLVDVANGSSRVIATFPGGAQRKLIDHPTPIVWRDDGTGFVVVENGYGAPTTVATVMLDGAVHVHFRHFTTPSPNGRLAALDEWGTACLAPGSPGLRLFDLDTNAEVARVEEPERGIINKEWAPDSSALLYEQFQAVPGTENDPCLPTYEPSSGRWFLLRPNGGPPESVADVTALRAQWQPEARVQLTCINGPTDIFDACPGLDARALSVNGKEIDRGEDIRLLGFVDPAAP